MGGNSLQFLLTFVLFLFCTKPTLSCIEQERQALLKIKEDLIDDYGHLHSWSAEEGSKDCCKWRGVRCSNQTGHIIMLNLNFSNLEPLRGKLSPFLIDLQYLNHLDVQNNDFNQSQIPNSIGSLSNLIHLDLKFANFGTNIPFHLGNLSSLHYLDLSWNNFNNLENLEWLPQLSSLRYLDMSSVNLSKVNNWLQVVNKLPYLTSLHLESCNLPSIFSVWLVNSSTSLHSLDLSDNSLTSSSSVLQWLFNFNTSVVKLDLRFNQFHGLIPDGFSKMKSLTHLFLDYNEFEGGIPKTFSGLCNLNTLSLPVNNLNGQLLEFFHNLTGCANQSIEVLNLDWNQIMGSLPDLITFPSLRELGLHHNHLNGTILDNLGKQSRLERLYLGHNSFEGFISEAHFSELTKLKYLDLSNTSLVFNFSSDWVPPFQLEKIALWSCQLGPQFPKWLQTQKNCIWLDISNSGISDSLFNSYWIFSPRLIYMNMSHNQISGHIPNLSLEFSSRPTIDLSSNKLEGEIPSFLFKVTHLDISNNLFSEPALFLCTTNNRNLSILDLSNNQLLGELPNCWMHFEGLKILNLANNRFHGKIPNSIGSLLGIEILDLGNNSFTGELPSSLKNCTKLKFVNLRDNKLSGKIPMWLGSSHPDLVVLFLRSNHFFGSIPSHLCHLTHLQLLDLALNHISGSIPKCINNLTALTSPISTIGHLYKGPLDFFHCDDLAFWLWKGRDLSSNLGQIKSIDLSSNKLTGPIPREIMELVGLISLNLSRNLLTRRITAEIGALRSLEVLDLSENQLSGGIPSSIALINSLNFLDLSNNNLSGIIPTGHQLNTFNATAYEGNPNLCGFPLPKKCPGETNQNTAVNRGDDHAGIQETEDGFITPGFYVSVALGFVIGFLGVFGTLLLNRSWRFSHFNFLNNVKDKMNVTVVVNMARLRRQHQT